MKTKKQIQHKIKGLELLYPSNLIRPSLVIGMIEALHWVIEK